MGKITSEVKNVPPGSEVKNVPHGSWDDFISEELESHSSSNI
jgi:hypothetical protein